MRGILLIAAVIAAIALPVIGMGGNVHAVEVIDPACQKADPNNLPTVCRDSKGAGDPLFGPDGVLTTVVNVLSVIAGVVAVFVILISGAKMITSAGDSNSVKEARNALLYAVISIVIVASAQILVRFILNKIS